MDPLLLDKVVTGLNDSGFAILAEAFDNSITCQLEVEFRSLFEAGLFHRAGIGKDQNFTVRDDVRRDATVWLNPATLSAAQARLWKELEELKAALNQHLFLGLWDLEGHFAHYPAGGFYRRHLDRFRDNNARAVSLVLYFNSDWQEADGGQLRLYPPAAREVTIEPRARTLVVFLSDRIEHEVLESGADRMSFAAWFRHRR